MDPGSGAAGVAPEAFEGISRGDPVAFGEDALGLLDDDATELNAQLQRALEVRVVVEQAKGILSERDGRPPGEAYERIRGHARDQQMTVRAVAPAVVDGTLRP